MRTDTPAFAQQNTALAKDPRYVIELAFDTALTQLWYFTSHADAALPPSGVAGSILAIVQGLSGTSQTLDPDKANASIGSITFNLADLASIVTTTLGGQLQLGRSTRQQRVRIYVGYQGLDWADYTLVQTQLVTEIAFSEGGYKFTCADVQRLMRKDIFDQAKTNLALSVLAADTTITVVSTTGFSTVAHGTSYSDAPSATVGYIKIEDEVIRYTGTTASTFTGCTRGALNTRAVDHMIDPTVAEDRRTAATEYVYLELPAVDLIYRLLTGKDRFGAAALPASWNLGVALSYVRLSDFTGIGKDLWDTSDDQQGFVVRLEDLTKTDGKKFIETELALLIGAFMPVYADGSLGLKRMANILAGAAYTGVLDESSLVSVGDLVHDFNSLHNVITISWNWDPLTQDFTRVDALVDSASIATHGRADPLSLKFRGLHGSRHSSVIIKQRFDALRDRYSGPPLRLDAGAVPSQNTVEVGDVKRVRLANVRDFTAPGGGGPLDRSFEVQNAQIDWITGAIKTKLFASSQAPGAIAATTDATVLPQAWYTGTGTDLSTVLTITGSNPGHISANGNLAGNADMNNAGAIYYYNGDLQLDAGVVVTFNNNVQLRVKGFFQVNGTFDGRGRGLAGAAAASAPGPFDLNGTIAVRNAALSKHNDGTPGFIGISEAGGGVTINFASVRGAAVAGLNPAMPLFNLAWDGTVLFGIPGDLRGSSGSSGMPVKYSIDGAQPWAMGAAGGAGGAGLCIVCRGIDLGANGRIDTSGGDGAGAPPNTFLVLSYFAGSGAGGAAAGLLVLLDGAGVAATDLTGSGFVASYGKTPVPAQPLAGAGSINGDGRLLQPPSGSTFYSFYVGTGDGSTFPVPGAQPGGNLASLRVQYVPGNPAAVPANPTLSGAGLESLALSNWNTLLDQASAKLLNAICWAAFLNKFIAAGNVVTTNPLLYTFANDLVLTNQANAMTSAILGLAASPSIAVAVGGAAGIQNAYSSTDAVTWTARGTTTAGLNGVCFGDKFVAVGNVTGSGAYILTSTDGITWTSRTNPQNVRLRAVAWNGKRYVAVGDDIGGTHPYIIFSDDGVTWTQASSIPNTNGASLFAVAWHLASLKWIAVGNHGAGSSPCILTSADGSTWSQITNSFAAGDDFHSLISTGNVLVGGGLDGGGAIATSMKLSDDGANWRIAPNPAGAGKYVIGLAWSGRRAVGVGGNSGATSTYIVASSSL